MVVRLRSQTVVLFYHTSRVVPPPSIQAINDRVSIFHYVSPFVIDYLLLSVPHPPSVGNFSHVYFLRFQTNPFGDVDLTNPRFSFFMESCDILLPFNVNNFRSLSLPIEPHVISTFSVTRATAWSSLGFKNSFYYFITSLLPPNPSPTLQPVKSEPFFRPEPCCVQPTSFFGYLNKPFCRDCATIGSVIVFGAIVFIFVLLVKYVAWKLGVPVAQI